MRIFDGFSKPCIRVVSWNESLGKANASGFVFRVACASGYVQAALPFSPVLGLHSAMHSFTAVFESSAFVYVSVYSEYRTAPLA